MLQLPPYETEADDQQSVYDYSIALGDDSFRVVLTHLQRQDRWYLDLYDSADDPLVMGYMLSVDVDLLGDLQIPGLPEGMLALYDTSGSGLECGFLDLGTRCELVYLDPSEYPEEDDPYEGITVTATP